MARARRRGRDDAAASSFPFPRRSGIGGPRPRDRGCGRASAVVYRPQAGARGATLSLPCRMAKPGNQLREILFGESIDLSTAQGLGAEARHLFAEAHDDLARGNKQAACRELETIGLMRELESLYRIHAWNLLRKAGGPPPTRINTDILGVVVEVGTEQGDDILAAYDDRTARYYNHSGAGIVWMRPDSLLDGPIDAVLLAAG